MVEQETGQEINKDYAGLENCFFCGDAKSVLLDRRLKKTLPHSAVYNKEPCDKCRKIMEQGVLFIAVRDGEEGKKNPYRTGQLIGLKDEAVKRMVKEPLLSNILNSRVCFIEESVLKSLGLLGSRGGLKFKKEFKEK